MPEQAAAVSPSPPQAEAPETSPEQEQERRWRFDQFRRLGFPLFEAEWLARSRVDHHAVRKAIGQGCEPEVVLRIFL